ncbi:hypothetical protein PV797_01590 [Clostridiaceae bacterium M8S5]|nr:hypothetical protein PV797_01590 [Clostridiaceae bacterium M8S5]
MDSKLSRMDRKRVKTKIYLDEMCRFAKKASKAGNDVDFKIYDGMVHCFLYLPVPEGIKALDEISMYIRKQLNT